MRLVTSPIHSPWKKKRKWDSKKFLTSSWKLGIMSPSRADYVNLLIARSQFCSQELKLDVINGLVTEFVQQVGLFVKSTSMVDLSNTRKVKFLAILPNPFSVTFYNESISWMELFHLITIGDWLCFIIKQCRNVNM